MSLHTFTINTANTSLKTWPDLKDIRLLTFYTDYACLFLLTLLITNDREAVPRLTLTLMPSLSFFFLTYYLSMMTALHLCEHVSSSLACSPREWCMGRGGAPCPCWTLTTVRPLPPSPHSVHERAWYVCPLPPSFTAWALSVCVCEVLTFSLSLTQWFLIQSWSPRTVWDFALCCERWDRAKIWTVERGTEDQFENHCSNLCGGMIFAVPAVKLCFLFWCSMYLYVLFMYPVWSHDLCVAIAFPRCLWICPCWMGLCMMAHAQNALHKYCDIIKEPFLYDLYLQGLEKSYFISCHSWRAHWRKK